MQTISATGHLPGHAVRYISECLRRCLKSHVLRHSIQYAYRGWIERTSGRPQGWGCFISLLFPRECYRDKGLKPAPRVAICWLVTLENKSGLPEWAWRERQRDMESIREHLHCVCADGENGLP